MKVSVIVAAYNAEKYLSETLNSLLVQTIDDYEVIIVNDGSSDNTLDILNSYKSRYSYMTIINKENGGPSSARNAGLDIAQGDFVFFFDADDILEYDALEFLYNTAIYNCADLVIAKYDVFNRYKTFPINNLNELVVEDNINKYDTKILWTFSLCNKLFRRSVIEKYELRLPPVSYSEDGVFLMEYIYHCSKISGLDRIVFHYRRMYDGKAESITASISPSKIRDYITAHQMILDAAQNSILRDYPQYSSIAVVKRNNPEMHQYLNEIIRKELQILLNHFYAKFWTLDENTVRLVVDEIKNKLSMIDMQNISLLCNEIPGVSLFRLAVTQREVLDNAFFTAVLYGDSQNCEEFLHCLSFLILQNFIFIKILVPFSMKTIIEENNMLQGNIQFADSTCENDLFHFALSTATTPYITFCDPKIVYTNNAFKFIFKRFIKSSSDFIIETIYHRNYGHPQPLVLSRAVLDFLKSGIKKSPFLSMDATLANKFFRVDFLKSQNLCSEQTIISRLSSFYKIAYYSFMNDGIVIYEGTENSFRKYIETPENLSFINSYLKDKTITLNSAGIVCHPAESYGKLQKLTEETFSNRILIKAIKRYGQKKLENQVLFFSIRRNGELEGNAKALYPYIKCKKVIYSKQLPHKLPVALKAVKLLMTSKVIITDDYIRYLRHFVLRPEQRVIQLWHACGAFKKFGQRGTNISLGTDRATHAQYNLVCVSGEAVRPIYADAFDINFLKVKALGSPRTDIFFDQKYIKEIQNKIYQKYPYWKDKYIIIYAPTFRDTGGNRTVFHPEIDFDQLSKDLLPNQLFLICPHPVMKNDILPHKYQNIQVIREFSTNDLMFISDLLITDYSSVIFEYVLLNKPIAFFCYDLETYDRGFYLKYPDDLPGDIYKTQKELTRYLTTPQKHRLTEKQKKFAQDYMSACDGHSSRRIADLIHSYMEVF